MTADGLFRFVADKLTGVCRLRFEHKFNGCSVVCLEVIERSSGLMSSVVADRLVAQWVAGGGGDAFAPLP